MKKTYLLIFLCCTCNIHILGSEKKRESFDAQLDREIRQQQDHWNPIDYDKYTAINKAKEQAYRENYNEINQLKENYANKIAVYEEKIATLMTNCKEKDKKIAALIFEREQKSIEDWHKDRTKKIVERVLEDDK